MNTTDFQDPINAIGMPNLADSAVALEFLLTIKSGVRNYAYAITETATPEVRNTLRKQLDEAIDLHDEVAAFMMKKGWLNPFHLNEQFKLDLKSAETAVSIAGMPLFPGDTDRYGTFATPPRQ